VSAFIAIAIFWHNIRDKRFEQIDKRFDEMKADFKELKDDVKGIHVDISDIKERLTAIEISTIFLSVRNESGDTASSRSEAMKRVWERKNAKKIEKKE